MVSDAQFAAMAEALFPALYRVCVSILRQPQDAQDAAQEALIKGWAHRQRIRSRTAQAYITRIAIHECRNIQRHRMREMPVEALPEENMPEEERDLDLRQAVDALPETLRLPLLLYYAEGWTDRMIASALKTTAVAVRSRLTRARRQLKARLELPNLKG